MTPIKSHGLTAILIDVWHDAKARMVKMEDLNNELLDRREFNGLCTALGLSLPAVSALFTGLSGASAFAAANDVDSNIGGRIVKFHDGTVIPALGQGSWHLGQGRHPAVVEEEALRTGLSLGMTLIDTAEGYSNGRSEELIGRAIAGQRDRVILVSKVDHMATGDAIARACEASLARLRTEHAVNDSANHDPTSAMSDGRNDPEQQAEEESQCPLLALNGHSSRLQQSDQILEIGAGFGPATPGAASTPS
jgi:Aldo/keto reductase family